MIVGRLSVLSLSFLMLLQSMMTVVVDGHSNDIVWCLCGVAVLLVCVVIEHIGNHDIMLLSIIAIIANSGSWFCLVFFTVFLLKSSY